LDEKGEAKFFVMGCYGIGVGRTLQTLIEVFSDDNGINLPVSVSPFSTAVVSLNVNDEKITSVSEKIYSDLTAMGIDVIYDDRKLSAGIKLKDIDLIGIPFKIVVGNRTIKDNKYELNIKKRRHNGNFRRFGKPVSKGAGAVKIKKSPRRRNAGIKFLAV
jgi:Prolyl-tRNA synthetase